MPLPVATAGGMTLHAYHSNTVIENLNRVGTPYSAGSFLNSYANEKLQNVTIRNSQFINDYAAGQHFKWGTRLYNLENATLLRLLIEGIDKEHGTYDNIVGALTIKNCIIRDCGAQGAQIVNRRIETADKLNWQVPGVHRIEGTTIEKCGQERGQGRAAFAVSMFGKQNDPYMENTGTFDSMTGTVAVGDTLLSSAAGLLAKITSIDIINKTWKARTPTKTGPTTDATLKTAESLVGTNGTLNEIVLVGAQVLKNGPRSPWDCPVELFQCNIVHTQTTPWHLYGAVMVEHRPYLHVVDGESSYVGTSKSDLWSVDYTPTVTVENHKFHGYHFIDIHHAQSVTFNNCSTDNNTKVRINGQVMGPVSNNIVWSA